MSEIDELLRERLPVPGPWLSTQLRLAAVVCPLVRHAGEDHVLLVARPEGQRQHAGQLAFPGGMRHGDEDPIACALRECHEEIGAPPSALTVLGMLPPRESSSGILVHCIVGRLAPLPLAPDAREVVRILHVPLRDLRDDTRWHERKPPSTAASYQPRTSPHFEFTSQAGGELLWGLTARFVRDLVARLAPLLVLCAVALAQELPKLWRLGPLPKNAVDVIVRADGTSAGADAMRADRTLLVRADAAAPWSSVHALLVRAGAVPLDVVLFAAQLPDGRDGAYTLALPESFDAPAELHVSMHRGRDGVPAMSLQLPLERLRRGFGADSPVALGVSAVSDAPFGQVLEALATAADAGFTRVVPWCVPTKEPAPSSADGRLAIDVAEVPAFAVPPTEARLQSSGIFGTPTGNVLEALAAGRPRTKSWPALLSPPPEPPNEDPVVLRVPDTWLGRQQLACGAWPNASNEAALLETALTVVYWDAMGRPGTDSVGFDRERDRGFLVAHGRGIGWLLARQRRDGSFVDGDADVRAAAIAAYALAEAEPVHGPGLRGSAEDALSWLAKVRRGDGGWSRVLTDRASDAITTAWCALAFEASEHRHLSAGLRPKDIEAWFAEVRNDDGSYRLRAADPNARHDGATAAALVALCLSPGSDSKPLEPVAAKFAAVVAFDDPMTTFCVSYGSFAIGGEGYSVWARRASVLVTSMRRNQPREMSWDPLAGLSPVATTALHGLALCNYYRYRVFVR